MQARRGLPSLPSFSLAAVLTTVGACTVAGGSGAGGGVPASGGRAGTGGRGVDDGTGGAVGPSGSGGSTATGGNSSGSGGTVVQPPPVPCATPLAGRVTVSNVAVTPKVETRGTGINSAGRPVILSVSPGGRAKVAWTDGTKVHVTPLNEQNARAGDDALVDGSEVRGFVAHDDGAAVLVRRGDAMVFVRLTEAGAEQATLTIVGGGSHTTSGSRWIDDWPHQGRLVWSGSQYAAYFGQTGNFGAQGNHQGDQYAMISPQGQRMTGGWDWGCSHSLDERLAHNGTTFAPICISDTYPGAGIFFNNRVKISAEPSVTSVGGVAKLGGLVAAADGFFLTFTSPEGRASADVVFTKVANNGTASGRTFLTDTASVQEGYSHLAAYGAGLLAGWDGGSQSPQVTLAVLDKAGATVEAAMPTTARIGGQDDFATFTNGDAGWAAAWEDLTQLRVVRVAACK